MKFYCTTPSCPVHIELCPHRRNSDPPPTIRSINLAHSHALTTPPFDVQVNMRKEQERRKDQVKRNGLERLKRIHDAVKSRGWPPYLTGPADLQNLTADMCAALGTSAWVALKEEARIAGIWIEKEKVCRIRSRQARHLTILIVCSSVFRHRSATTAAAARESRFRRGGTLLTRAIRRRKSPSRYA